jgi:RNA polymerase-interacting CarD/CdnL/TRCF family regulator
MASARSSNIEEQEIAGVKLELYIVDFEKEKLRLKVPTNRAEQKGMRHLADRVMIETAHEGDPWPRPHQAHHVVAPCPGV